MKFSKVFIAIFLAAVVIYYGDNQSPTVADDPNENPTTNENATINPAKTYQTIESFAASDYWLPNYIGTFWSSTEKEVMAKLLFSQNISGGKPAVAVGH